MKSLPLSLLSCVLLLPTGAAQADEDELYKAKHCFACHRIDHNHHGPAFRKIAAKYADDAGAEAALTKKIREGGGGVWGETPMPPQPHVTEAEAATLARWILRLK